MWQELFARGMDVGAPPDEFNTLGQNWGLAPLDPGRLKLVGYEPIVRIVRSALRHMGGLRLDHVMDSFGCSGSRRVGNRRTASTCATRRSISWAWSHWKACAHVRSSWRRSYRGRRGASRARLSKASLLPSDVVRDAPAREVPEAGALRGHHARSSDHRWRMDRIGPPDAATAQPGAQRERHESDAPGARQDDPILQRDTDRPG